MKLIASVLFAGLCLAQAPAFAAGFDCNDPAWCLAVADDGRIFLGNPAFGDGGMKDTKKRAWDSNERRENFILKCIPSGVRSERGFLCYGFDGKGNRYAGTSRDPNEPDFFHQCPVTGGLCN